MTKPFKIETIHAFIATDPDGVEGVPAIMLQDGEWFPLIAADPERLDMLRPMAKTIAKAGNQKFVLAKFSVREDLEVVG